MISLDNLLQIKYISPKKGKGIIAKRDIKKGTLVEKAHVILLSNKEYEQIQDTILYQYVYEWDDSNKPDFKNAIAKVEAISTNNSVPSFVRKALQAMLTKVKNLPDSIAQSLVKR